MKIFRLENTKGDSSSFLTNKELRLDNSYKNDLTKNKPEILSTARVVYINEILVSESPFNFESTTPCPFKEILKGIALLISEINSVEKKSKLTAQRIRQPGKL